MGISTMFCRMIYRHLVGMSPDERIAYLAKLLWNSRYGWGKEIIGGADCSGSVCWGLWLLGYKIRVSADFLYRELTLPLDHQSAPKSGNLVFWLRADKAFHVAVVEHDCIVMDAGRRFRSVPAHIVHDNFKDSEMEIKRLDWSKVEEISESGRYAYGVDLELGPLLGLFNQNAPRSTEEE